MNKLREAALAALRELDYIEQTGDISTGSHMDVAQKLHAALAEDRLNEMQSLTESDYHQKIGEQEFKFREPGVKIWEQQMALTPFGEQELHAAGWRRCAEGQGETQHCALLEAAVLAEKAKYQELQDVIDSIYTYANDTLSGRIDGPDDREWQHAAVVEIRNRARVFATSPSAIRARGKA